MKADIC